MSILKTGAIVSEVPCMQLKVWEGGGEGGGPARDRGMKRSMKGFENEVKV